MAFIRLALFAAIMIAMVAVGFRAFTTNIATASGQTFDQLSIVQIRRAQTSEARGGGLLALMGSMGTVLACLGIYGTLRYSRFWLILSTLALWVTLRSPSRLEVLSLIVVMAAFYMYARRCFGKTLLDKSSRRIFPLLILSGAGLGALLAFNSIGSKLGKNQSAALLFPQYTWPEWTLSPSLYFSGGFPALAQALRLHAEPFGHGSSYFSLARLANVFIPDIEVPETIGAYVGVPWRINIYTGFGNPYFDLGILGVILLLAILGWLATVAHAKAMQGQLEWAWVSAVVAGVLFALPQGFHLFNLAIDFQLFVGFLVFWAIRRSRLPDGSRRKRHLGVRIHRGG